MREVRPSPFPGAISAWLSLRQQLLVSGGQLGTASDMMFLRLVFPLIVFGAILGFIAASYKSQWLLTISACVLAQKYVEGFLDLSYAYMQKSNNWKSLAISTVVRCVLLVVVFAAVYVLTDHLAVGLPNSALLIINTGDVGVRIALGDEIREVTVATPDIQDPGRSHRNAAKHTAVPSDRGIVPPVQRAALGPVVGARGHVFIERGLHRITWLLVGGGGAPSNDPSPGFCYWFVKLLLYFVLLYQIHLLCLALTRARCLP